MATDDPKQGSPAGERANAPSDEPAREEAAVTNEAPAGTIPAANPIRTESEKPSAPDKPVAVAKRGAPPRPPGPPKPPENDQPDEEEGMLRMSFLEHLEELRARLIRAVIGLGVAFVACLFFSERLWLVIQEPAHAALVEIHAKITDLIFTSPTDSVMIIYMKLPLVCSLFIASPWILYQVWAFISPGLYKRERRWATPFILCSAGLFITGGLFAYFLAFRYALVFLLGLGRDINITPMITITEYFDLFVDVVLGIGLVFETPIIIVFLTLLRIATPSFLLAHSRYAILIITILAAVITPTPDVFNMMLFAVPMVLLYFVGVFASWVIVLRRERKRFPWRAFFIWLAVTLLFVAGVIYVLVVRYHYKLVLSPPFLVR